MKQILLILAVVALVGCGEKPKWSPEEVFEATAEVIETEIRKELGKPTGELTKADYEKVTWLNLNDNQLHHSEGLEKLTQLNTLGFAGNALKDLENLTQLRYLNLKDNTNLTKAQIDELQKALPKCQIYSDH